MFWLNTLATPRACIAKSILEKEKFNTKLRIGEDTGAVDSIAARNNTYFHTKKTYIQVEHDNRSVNQNSALEHLKTLNYIFKNPDIYIRINIRHQLLSNAYFNLSKSHFIKGENYNGMRFLMISIFKKLNHPQTKYKFNILANFLLLNRNEGMRLLNNRL